MNNKIPAFAIVALFSFLVGCPSNGEQRQTESEPMFAHPDKRVDLWVVTKLDLAPGDTHIDVGDAFRIKKTGHKYRLEPLYLLRKRWKKEKDFSVDLEENGELLCGEVKLTSHSKDVDRHIAHLYKLRQKPDGGLKIEIEVWTDGQNLIAQCTPTKTNHGGIAHAEN